MKELTIEDKQLLLKDLCARLPYGVKVQTPVMNDEITLTCGDISAYFFNPDNKVFPKPYLRPMSSMTEEEKKEFSVLAVGTHLFKGPLIPSYDTLDWLNAHHFDYRGLIDKGLALEAPKGMYTGDKFVPITKEELEKTRISSKDYLI